MLQSRAQRETKHVTLKGPLWPIFNMEATLGKGLLGGWTQEEDTWETNTQSNHGFLTCHQPPLTGSKD